jgi:hypothetical protein
MERNEAVFIAALNGCSHLLLTDVAKQLPAAAWDFLNVGDWLHQRRVPDGNFWDPDGTQQVSPF